MNKKEIQAYIHKTIKEGDKDRIKLVLDRYWSLDKDIVSKTKRIFKNT